MLPKGERMHIDRTNQITVASEAALAAHPIAVLGFVLMPTSGTPTTSSSFGVGEARDVSLFGFVREIVDVFAILPLAHPLVVVLATILVADPMWIANEERAHLVFNTEVDHLASGLVTQITDAPGISFARLVLGPLQFLPATGILLAARLLLGQLTKLFVALSLERTDPSSGDDERLGGRGRDSGQMDFAQVNSSLLVTGSRFGAFDFETHVQFKAPIPDQGTGPGFLW